MNRTWNQSRSATTQARLRENPEEWAQYHTLYREARKDWSVVPFEEFIRWAKQRSDCVIGDFGCGEAKVAEALADRHTIHSFDYVPANDDVVACDMAKTPLEDGTLDVALFSLSLMGVNFTDYLREVWRVLKLDGQLHIFEATSRFSNRDAFVVGAEETQVCDCRGAGCLEVYAYSRAADGSCAGDRGDNGVLNSCTPSGCGDLWGALPGVVAALQPRANFHCPVGAS